MNRRLKVIIISLMCTSLLSSLTLTDVLAYTNEDSTSIKGEITEEKQKLKSLEDEKEDVLLQLQEINETSRGIETELATLNSNITVAEERIEEYELKENVLKEELAADKELMDLRMRALYMNQGESYMEALFNSSGIMDLLKRLENIVTILKYDNDLIDDYQKKEEELNLVLTESKKEKDSLEIAKKESEEKKAEIDKNNEEKSALLASIEGDINYQESLIAQKEAEFEEILSAINNVGSNSRPSRGDGSGIFSITGNISYPITSGYGWRVNPISGKQEFQAAIDIGAPHGATVYSLQPGTVAYSGWMSGYGNVVVINHGSISSLYAHNSSLLVSVGQSVSGGQPIALVGSTGNSTGPHIHFEVTSSSGEKLDPTPYYIY
ncbi:MAG: peptidoglycan DD-metalloendopeptidase family protein [Clostridium sp.]|nr:peptidoglycan DD-metalloendopeptidase family protein [Clostridium sp.]